MQKDCYASSCHRYEFDSLGNLEQRKDLKNNVTQSFCYDGLNRIKAARFNGCTSAANDYTYDLLGNVKTKQEVAGTFLCGAVNIGTGSQLAGSHAVTQANGYTYQYDRNGNLTTATKTGAPTKSVVYSPFNTPTSITEGSKWSNIIYSPNQDRIKHSDSNGRVTKYVGGLYEEVTHNGVTQKIHYVGDQILFVQKSTSPSESYQYLHRDHIGSIVAITGSVVNTQADVQYLANDVWGERRFQQWNGPLDDNFVPTGTARGFTDHEHLDSVGLIHMNGRVYDQELGRFLSADPLIQAPHNTQSYNRYSYVFNNPLSFVDPSGFECETYHYTRLDEKGQVVDKWSETERCDKSGGAHTLSGMDANYFSQAWNNAVDRQTQHHMSSSNLPANLAHMKAMGDVSQAVGEVVDMFTEKIIAVQLGVISLIPGGGSVGLLSRAKKVEQAADALVVTKGVGSLSKLSNKELNAIIKKEGGVGPFRNLMGTGLAGAEKTLKNMPASTQVTREGAAAYRELATRIIAEYQKTGNTLGIKTQQARIEILDKLF